MESALPGGSIPSVATTTATTKFEKAHGVEALLSLAAITQEKSGAQIVGAGLIQRSSLKTDRAGHSYAALTVLCADGGTIEARWWRYPYAAEACPEQGTVWRLSGQMDVFQGTPQLRLAAATAAPEIDIGLFARAARRPLSELQSELERLIDDAGAELAPLVRAVLSGEAYERFCAWPAAQSHHGAVRHGLLAHSIRVARLAQGLADAYGLDMLTHDHELVIAAALLHDVGKVWTLPRIAGGPMPEQARQLDHVTVGVLMTRSAAERLTPGVSDTRLTALLHAILAHHGTREWGAQVEPHSVEAWLTHLADLAEARLWEWSAEA